MSRVAFISTNLCAEPYPVYPLGMAIVSAALARAGHSVKQFDALLTNGDATPILDSVRQLDPDVICLSVRNMDTVDSLATADTVQGLETARRFVQEIRKVSRAPIIVGGSGFSIAPDAALELIGADYGVAGEGEQAAPALVDALAAGRPVPRLTRSWERLMSMDAMPEPLHAADLMRHYYDTTGILNAQTKRGCSLNCNYCVYPFLEGTRFRVRPVEAVIDELRRLRREFGVDLVFLTDSVFNDPAGDFRELLEALIRAELHMRWVAYFAPRLIEASDVALCKRAGLYAVELGTDASSDTTLAALGKSFSWSDVADAAHRFTQAEIPCAHFIMFGGPEEDDSTLEEGLRNTERLPHAVVFGYSGIRAFPGTALYGRAVAEGVIPGDASPLDSTYYISPKIDKAAMDKRIASAWANRYDRVFPPEAGTHMAATLRAFGHKGLLWDRLLRSPAVGRRRSRSRLGTKLEP